MASQKKKKHPALIIGIIVVVFIILMVVFNATGNNEVSPVVEKGEYDTFAQCLYDSGMRMYGSATCSFCARQRNLFGLASFEHIKEIECDPRNEGAETERCVAKNITHTPTWIYEDESGNDIHRFESGMVPLEELAQVSGCELIKDSE